MLDLRIFYKIVVVFVALASLAEGKVPFLVSQTEWFYSFIKFNKEVA